MIVHDKQGWPRKRRRNNEMKVNGEKMSTMIDEAYLYKYMPKAEQYLLAEIPPEEELDHKFSRRFERKMKALIKYERRTPRERKFYHRAKIVFAMAALVLLVIFGSAMSVKASRLSIIQFFIEVFEDLTSYSVEDGRPEGVNVVPIEPDYIPEGYREVQRKLGDPEFFIWYENTLGDKMYYNQAVVNMGIRFWDTEVSNTDEVKIDGRVVHIIEEERVHTVYWNDEKYIYRIAGPGSLELEELLKMVRRVMKKVE